MIRDVMLMYGIETYIFDPSTKTLFIYQSLPVHRFVKIRKKLSKYVDNYVVKSKESD